MKVVTPVFNPSLAECLRLAVYFSAAVSRPSSNKEFNGDVMSRNRWGKQGCVLRNVQTTPQSLNCWVRVSESDVTLLFWRNVFRAVRGGCRNCAVSKVNCVMLIPLCSSFSTSMQNSLITFCHIFKVFYFDCLHLKNRLIFCLTFDREADWLTYGFNLYFMYCWLMYDEFSITAPDALMWNCHCLRHNADVHWTRRHKTCFNSTILRYTRI